MARDELSQIVNTSRGPRKRARKTAVNRVKYRETQLINSHITTCACVSPFSLLSSREIDRSCRSESSSFRWYRRSSTDLTFTGSYRFPFKYTREQRPWLLTGINYSVHRLFPCSTARLSRPYLEKSRPPRAGSVVVRANAPTRGYSPNRRNSLTIGLRAAILLFLDWKIRAAPIRSACAAVLSCLYVERARLQPRLETSRNRGNRVDPKGQLGDISPRRRIACYW